MPCVLLDLAKTFVAVTTGMTTAWVGIQRSAATRTATRQHHTAIQLDACCERTSRGSPARLDTFLIYRWPAAEQFCTMPASPRRLLVSSSAQLPMLVLAACLQCMASCRVLTDTSWDLSELAWCAHALPSRTSELTLWLSCDGSERPSCAFQHEKCRCTGLCSSTDAHCL